MRNIKYFNDKITSIASELTHIAKYTKRETTVMINEIQALKMCRDYLKTNPSEEFIKSEITKLEQFNNEKLAIFDGLHDKAKVPQKLYTKLRNDFEKKWDIGHKRKQLHWLRLLLD